MDRKLTIFDPAEGLASDEAIEAFIAEALAAGDADYIAHALDVAARAGSTAPTAASEARQVIAAQGEAPYQLSDEENADLDAAEEEVARGDFATDEEIAAVLSPRRA